MRRPDRDAREGPRRLAGGHAGPTTGTRARTVGHALLALGVEPGDRVAIHSENRREWLYADVGAIAVRADDRRPVPDQPGRRGRLPAVALRRPGARSPRTRSRWTRRSRCSTSCPTWSRSSTSSRAASATATTDPKLLAWDDFLALGAEHRDVRPGRGGAADGRGHRGRHR